MKDDNELVTKSFNDIKQNLSMHVSNKFLFREDQVRVYNGTKFDDKTDWSSKNMRRIYFSDCKFLNVNLRSTGLTGSIFKDCDFSGGNLDFTIFDEVMFINCSFFDCSLNATSFCKSEFINSKMINLKLDACFFTEAIFDGFDFIDCEISDIIWENAKFQKCNFNDVILQKLNFEFTYFEEIHFNNTTIPFASLPFIFGGMKYIFNTKDNVYIKTVHPDYENNRLTRQQYLDFLPDILMFYKQSANFFPLANILLGIGDLSEGINAIINGLEFWFRLHNYKIMFYFCDLANTYNFSIEDRKRIFETIEKCSSWVLINESWNNQKQWNIQQCKMRDCLLNSQSIPYVTLEFATSINCHNYTILAKFMDTVDSLLLPPNSYYSIELRHNSPFNLLYTIFSDEQTLFNSIVGIITILGVCDQLYSNHLKNRIKKKQEANTFSQHEQKKIEDNIKKNVISVNYNFYNCNINNLDTSHFTRQSIGCVNPESSGNNQ